MPALSHSTSTPLYRPDIDGLRAVAILGVVAYHIGIPGITGGFTGVDVFFVISGFLITQLLVRQVDTTGRLSLAEFYTRRMRRLLPALGVVIAATLIAGMFILPPTGDRHLMIESALASLGFVANHFFLVNTAGYFDGPSELKPLLHLWSLSVEEQFYILWPLALILVTLVMPVAKRRTWFRITIGAITLTSFLSSVMLVHAHQSMAFFISPSRAWELGIGALLSLAPAAFPPQLKTARPTLSWLGFVLIAAAYTLIEPSSSFPGFYALLPAIGTGLIIYGNALAPNNFCARLLRTRPTVRIGVLSYAWYLWDWPLLAFARTERLMAPKYQPYLDWAVQQ
jgi:peptidoglycan/LPS O-acetylase OafA/YrhL